MVDRPDVVRDNPNVPKYHSNFELKQSRLSTELFGLIKPHFVIDDVSSDDFDYRPDYKTRSYTLKAPLMQDVHRKLSYIKVDLPSILPMNFEKFFTNPVIGDDVPNDVGTVVAGGYKKIADLVDGVIQYAYGEVKGANKFTPANVTLWLKALIFGELFYSRGSLLSALGSHNAKQLVFRGVTDSGTYPNKILTYDRLFDIAFAKVINVMDGVVDTFTCRFGSSYKVVSINGNNQDFAPDVISVREFLSEIRSSSDWEITQFGGPTPQSISDNYDIGTIGIYKSVASDLPFNYGRCCAYQLAVAEYFTNDKVDHIYSSELYRQYIFSLINSYFPAVSLACPLMFQVNGMSYQYDYLSGAYMTALIDFISINLYEFCSPAVLEYFISIFGYKRSLRYKDYFVSSRVRPLAVGSVDVSVNNNAVSVIDITKNIQVQRFLNAVNHSGRRLSNYIKTFFGISIPPDRHVPHWLADLDELVYTSEVENTADAQQTEQNSITARFTGNSGNKQLHFYVDFPGYIIGLTSYDIERAYVDTIDRSFFIENRFDMFIPEMQFVGDQPVFAQELSANDSRAFGTPFGYQYRDMQYKLFISTADGGFVENLPGFAFLYNPAIWNEQNISPDFIRSKTSELDDFYLSLSGYSLGSYFHFISLITNNVSAKRPMIANPKILE